MSIDDNFYKLVEAASSGTPNAMLKPVNEAINSRVKLLTETATSANGAEPTKEEKIKIHAEAKNWVKGEWAKGQLHELKNGAEEHSNDKALDTAAKGMAVFDSWGDGITGLISGVISIFKNFKNQAMSFIESHKTGRKYDEILAEREASDKMNTFAKNLGISSRELTEQLKNPTAEALAIKPPPVTQANTTLDQKAVAGAGAAAVNAGVKGGKHFPNGSSQTPPYVNDPTVLAADLYR